jgi:hypothetical protein
VFEQHLPELGVLNDVAGNFRDRNRDRAALSFSHSYFFRPPDSKAPDFSGVRRMVEMKN